MNNTEIKAIVCKTFANLLMNKYKMKYEEVFDFLSAEIKDIISTEPPTIHEFTQSQAHGLFWDNEIRQKVFGLPLCKNDTKKFDIDCIENKFNHNENISIKTSGCNNIDCGDILRFYDRDNINTNTNTTNTTNNITIILIRFSQINDKKSIHEILEINYSEEMKNILFGDATRRCIRIICKMYKKYTIWYCIL